MSRIIAARFDTFPEAQCVAQTLAAESVATSDVDILYVNPAGQHGTFVVGGDELADEGARKSGAGAGAGALVGGGAGAAIGAAVVAPLAGPLAGAAAAGVGAYLGALAGSLATTRDPEPEPSGHEPQQKATRAAGVLVAVCVDHVSEERVIDALRAHGGKDVEVAEGMWKDGHWKNFDPVSPPTLIDPQAEF